MILTLVNSRVENAAKISDIANMNFTAEQQVQLENSRATNTMNLNNLSNSQAMVMAEAAALAQMDTFISLVTQVVISMVKHLVVIAMSLLVSSTVMDPSNGHNS